MRCFLHIRVTLLLLTISFLSQGQDIAIFEKTYDRISTETAQKNLDIALVSADSLYRASKKPLLRIRSLILIARLYQQKEDLEKSIKYVLKAEQLAKETGDYTWQAKANSYLAGLYRMIELYEKSKSYSEKALKIIPQIKDSEQANSTRGLMLQELAFTNKDQGNYKQAIRHLQQAAESIDKLKKNREFNLLNNERLLGDNYRLLTSYDSALTHYRKAVTLSSAVPVGYVTCLVYRGIAETLLEKGDLREVKRYLDKAQKIADESQYLQIQESVYDLSQRYYAKVKDQNKLIDARQKKDSITGILLDKRAGLLDGMYSQVEQEGLRVAMANGQKNIAILVSVVLLLAGIIFFIFYRRKQKAELARVKLILAQQNKRKSEQGTEQNTPVPTMATGLREDTLILPAEKDQQTDSNDFERKLMSIETEHFLLIKLTEFEKSEIFLENSFSLPSLASWMETNTKYLSYLIKKHKNTDFNSYINALRIDFVIEMLKVHPQWRQYKISALAAMSGFSSHSQFTAVFKTHTGLSPSVFIRHLTNECE